MCVCVCGLLTVKVRHEKVPHGSRQALAKCPLSVNGSTLTQRLLLDGFDPLFFLLRGGGRYPVHYVVSLDDASIRLRFAGLDYLTFMVGVVELKAVLKKNHETVDLHDERIREHIVCVFWIFLAVQRYLNLNERRIYSQGQEVFLTGFLGSSTRLFILKRHRKTVLSITYSFACTSFYHHIK